MGALGKRPCLSLMEDEDLRPTELSVLCLSEDAFWSLQEKT